MNAFQTLTSNYIVNIGFLSWCSAQIIKTILTLALTKRFDAERLIGSGGMPSSHSALVSSIAIGTARTLGYSSPEFGLAIAFAAIVMYDAMGVRRAAGEQAKVLNRIIFNIPDFNLFKKPGQDGAKREKAQEDKLARVEEKQRELKEFLGHTPLEVLAGCLLGILIAVFVPVT